ncbi:ABC transporter permease subunit [Cohnella algarum]|uniref:ABC transporter permease subunit n=1 Tax=Cohnella algarum TaxID=2044859 RepID=UPI001966FE32|nr:ABC transporter permease subunit [Cohnella algarum]MBN2981143.1 ABC transporter permease subunit [Cohnella algarum]
MRDKALWSREYAQAKLFVWFVPALHFFTLGFARINDLLFDGSRSPERLEAALRSGDAMQVYQFGNLESVGRGWMLLAAFVLALVQFGTERRNGSQEFLFSLPYSRRRIFCTKWLFGAALIVSTFSLNTAIDMVAVLSSPAAELFSLGYHFTQWLYSIVLLLAAYSFVALVGTITGTVASQTTLSLFLWAAPMSMYIVADESFGIMFGRDLFPDSYLYEELQDFINIPGYIALSYEFITWGKMVVFALVAGALVLLGMRGYERNKPENNGKFLMFGWLELAVQTAIVVLASLLAGNFAAGVVRLGDGRLGFLFGLAIGCAASLLLTAKLKRIRLKS